MMKSIVWLALPAKLFSAMVERFTTPKDNELAIHLAQAEEQFASGQFVSLQEAVARLEEKWQRDEQNSAF